MSDVLHYTSNLHPIDSMGSNSDKIKVLGVDSAGRAKLVDLHSLFETAVKSDNFEYTDDELITIQGLQAIFEEYDPGTSGVQGPTGDDGAQGTQYVLTLNDVISYFSNKGIRINLNNKTITIQSTTSIGNANLQSIQSTQFIEH